MGLSEACEEGPKGEPNVVSVASIVFRKFEKGEEAGKRTDKNIE